MPSHACFPARTDLIFNPELIDKMEIAGPNIVLTEYRENRCASAINCSINENKELTLHCHEYSILNILVHIDQNQAAH